MNKIKIIDTALVLFFAIACFFVGYLEGRIFPKWNSNFYTNIEKKSDISKVCFNERCFDVEIADTPEARAQGLMNRESLNQNSGMLFLFDTEAEYSFWMKNTLIFLDIIWLDENKKVVFVKHNAEPCQANSCETFGPSKKAKYVLEINSGLAKKIGLEEEDYLEFK